MIRTGAVAQRVAASETRSGNKDEGVVPVAMHLEEVRGGRQTAMRLSTQPCSPAAAVGITAAFGGPSATCVLSSTAKVSAKREVTMESFNVRFGCALTMLSAGLALWLSLSSVSEHPPVKAVKALALTA